MEIGHLEASQLMAEIVEFFEEIGVELWKAGNLPLDNADYTSLIDLLLEKNGKVWNAHNQEWEEMAKGIFDNHNPKPIKRMGIFIDHNPQPYWITEPLKERRPPGHLYIGHRTEHRHEGWAGAFDTGKTYTEIDYEGVPEGEEEETVSLPGVYVRVNRVKYTHLGETRTGIIVDHELDENGKIVVLQDEKACFNRVAPENVIEQWVDGSYVNLSETEAVTLE